MHEVVYCARTNEDISHVVSWNLDMSASKACIKPSQESGLEVWQAVFITMWVVGINFSSTLLADNVHWFWDLEPQSHTKFLLPPQQKPLAVPPIKPQPLTFCMHKVAFSKGSGTSIHGYPRALVSWTYVGWICLRTWAPNNLIVDH